MLSSRDMGSFFYQTLETGDQGELADIVRASGGGGGAPSPNPMIFPPPKTDLPTDDFKDVIATCNFQEFGAKASPFSPRPIKPAPIVPPISSLRAPGIKRRKGQAKKVVCIPAPPEGSSRTSGEAVPSDLWAWRKYGQKPIKGSPYPRGYYKCSSSKGCSARKQVERSRSNPTMLVITYTSEHNHPWPTQRNSLACSTRSYPPKNDNPSTSKNSPPQSQRLPAPSANEEPTKEMASSSSPVVIKEEDCEFERFFDRGYEPMMLESKDIDFFADLGGLEPDPMSLIFTSREHGDNKLDEERENTALDPLSFFDWDEAI